VLEAARSRAGDDRYDDGYFIRDEEGRKIIRTELFGTPSIIHLLCDNVVGPLSVAYYSNQLGETLISILKRPGKI
jgi:hypothetical protein